MVLLLIPILIITLLYLIRFSTAVSKFFAVFIDFLLICGFTAYFLHGEVSVKIASGNAVYFWDIAFGIGVCVLYYVLLNFLVIHLPMVAAFINYIIAWIGTFLIYGVIFTIFIGGLPQLLNNHSLNMLINIIIVSLLALMTFKIRKNIFNTQHEYSEA